MSDTAIKAVEDALAKAKQELATAKDEEQAARGHLSRAQQTRSVWEAEVQQLQQALDILKGAGR